MSSEAVNRARKEFVRNFRWTDGHADLAPVFHDGETLAALGPGLASPFLGDSPTVVIGVEARGFVLAPLCAGVLGVGIVLARKSGAVHPGPTVDVTTEPDWRGNRTTFRIARVLGPSDRVLMVDDWVETGSQVCAIAEAVRAMGASVVGVSVLVDQATSAVRGSLNVVGLLRYDELPPSG